MKQEDKFVVKIKLHKKFINKIQLEMEDELEKSIKKWGVNLNEDEQLRIIDHSFNQLIQKVSENARISWDLGDEIEIRVTGLSGNITLPTESQKNKKIEVMKTRVGWEVSHDDENTTILMKDFKEHYEELIIKWARTGVFYGVGSYSS